MRSPLDRAELDDLDRALVARLRIDGRESSRSLAAALSVNEVTVAGRLRRLEEAGIMRVVAVTDMRLFGHREFAMTLVQVSGRSPYRIAAELAALPESVSVTICTGRCDIIVPILGRDHRHLGELLDTVLPGIDGVDDVRASLALDVLKFDSKWSLLEADPGATPAAQPSETVDETDLEIIRTLQLRARRSNRSIAAELGISEGTVRSRIKRMLSQRVFRIQAVCDVVAFGLSAHAFIGIDTAPGTVDAVAAELTRRDDIAQLTRVLGDFDLMAVLIAPDRDALVAAILNEISQIPGVRNTETFDTCATLKHTYSWTWGV
ncbi:Lrp/AsnC family transcriptional regulator [Nocardia nova]|uniref:Lrp/AsnC family transcriptional regulator n=1 Tax=Nocardia nova TaxID=37330 RepID=UPI0025B03D9D|nr:Lrp/AsnC family transcriptional regulator [Nocardia nova]MDN2499240.1 Lrp/AsnC family transcriptional regulator [Nocardia nova]